MPAEGTRANPYVAMPPERPFFWSSIVWQIAPPGRAGPNGRRTWRR